MGMTLMPQFCRNTEPSFGAIPARRWLPAAQRRLEKLQAILFAPELVPGSKAAGPRGLIQVLLDRQAPYSEYHLSGALWKPHHNLRLYLKDKQWYGCSSESLLRPKLLF